MKDAMWERRCATHDWRLSQWYVDPKTGWGAPSSPRSRLAAAVRRRERRRCRLWVRLCAAMDRDEWSGPLWRRWHRE